eukprot:2765253-Rhodomonas_salina.1
MHSSPSGTPSGGDVVDEAVDEDDSKPEGSGVSDGEANDVTEFSQVPGLDPPHPLRNSPASHASHAVQVPPPLVALYVLLGHDSHVPALDAPQPSRYCPAPQLPHVVQPSLPVPAPALDPPHPSRCSPAGQPPHTAHSASSEEEHAVTSYSASPHTVHASQVPGLDPPHPLRNSPVSHSSHAVQAPPPLVALYV